MGWDGLPLPTREQAHWVALFHQQLWCWGKDVRRPENGLVEMGFIREPAPIEQRLCSRYMIRDLVGTKPVERIIGLWGFGMLFGLQGRFIFMRRYDRRIASARLEAIPEGHDPESIERNFTSEPSLDEPYRDQLFEMAIDWILEYESLVRQRWGIDYRSQTVAAFPGQPRFPPDRMIVEWESLANHLAMQASYRKPVPRAPIISALNYPVGGISS